jgi:hypothetical protein
MATLRERLKARQAERRKLRSFTVGVSEDDLRVIAKQGYGGSLSTDHEQQAQAVSPILDGISRRPRPARAAAFVTAREITP